MIMLATNAKNKDDLTYYQKRLVIGRIFSIITREINSTDLVNIAAISGYHIDIVRWAVAVIRTSRLLPEIDNNDVDAPRYTPDYMSYINHDLDLTKEISFAIKAGINSVYGQPPAIKKVIFKNPATIVFWRDGTKTVVKAINEPYDPEKGLAMACAKKMYGNQGNYYKIFKKWLPKDDPLE